LRIALKASLPLLIDLFAYNVTVPDLLQQLVTKDYHDYRSDCESRRAGSHRTIACPRLPELPGLEVVQEVHNHRSLGQTILTAKSIPPGGPIVVRDLTGLGFGLVLASGAIA
jgi:hypothetical protein